MVTLANPTLDDERLAERLDLMRGSDTVELKLTVPDTERRPRSSTSPRSSSRSRTMAIESLAWRL
jgi:hypothetical protein